MHNFRISKNIINQNSVMALIVILFLESIALYGRPPMAPFNPWGTVTLLGEPAPHGATVQAFINNTLVATMRDGIKYGYYSIIIPPDDLETPVKEGGTQGDEIVIKVNGNAVRQTLSWDEGSLARYDLETVNRRLIVSESLPSCQEGEAEFSTISAALQYANDGDTIIVCPGNYQDSLNVNKSVSITGSIAETTILTVVSTGIDFIADDVSISCLTITGLNFGPCIDIAGKRAKITHNIISNNNHYGILLGAKEGQSEILNNTISMNEYGIYINGSSNNHIANNNISSNRQTGIMLGSSDNNRISENVIENDLYGITISDSNDNHINSNTIRNNERGIAVNSGLNNTIENNNIVDNTYNIYNNHSQSISARNNWWGTTICSLIDRRIYDREEGGAEVIYDPILDAEYPAGTPTSCDNMPLVVHTVSPPCVNGVDYYPSISWAVMMASDGDTIIVCPGSYNDQVDISRNNLTIQSYAGPSVTTVEGFSYAFLIYDDQNVTIKGFTISGRASSPGDGIRLIKSTSAVITDNVVIGNDRGIWIDNQSSDNLVYNNSFQNNNSNARDENLISTNTWNLPSLLQETNIIGGPFIGGNYWDDYLGEDPNNDGIGTTLLPYNSNGNILDGGDYLPLVTIP